MFLLPYFNFLLCTGIAASWFTAEVLGAQAPAETLSSTWSEVQGGRSSTFTFLMATEPASLWQTWLPEIAMALANQQQSLPLEALNVF